ncbi:gliding motility protein GldB-related protein [Pedobacter montanisoli]|uniref:DUF2268 domain-containing protein n=1 Tax=Pedobacter montanisoli TaxID=2923277 RepID=A0ABS9ZWV2_9SPHI|nr:DUF2268 domain-containing putative Zn-dependent protease [Pedobacter montanisoli]MCJ0742795.1 DUF2268 domain-containing protein [Pedobacter montanisoli]
MRNVLLAFILLVGLQAFAQKDLKLYDMSQMELRLMNRYKNQDSASRSKIFIDSVYTPYKAFWEGYLGNGEAVAKWMNEALSKLPEWQEKNKNVDGKALLKQFKQMAKEMRKLTGYEPKGKWYVVYGPAWTDLGGLGDFAMLIDLAHPQNNSNEAIVKMFPHELTHQIMTNVNPHRDTTAISSIVGEGFAVWMNQKYWKQKFTLAQNLGYTEEGLQVCDKNIEALKKFFLANKYSADREVINLFRNRGAKLNEKLPGAIGYYIGYKIVDAYVQKHGANSWKDIFIKSPREIYENSGFTN